MKFNRLHQVLLNEDILSDINKQIDAKYLAKKRWDWYSL